MLNRSKKAFTLLELIVVIVVLGILAAIAIPTFAAVIEKARVNTAKAAAEAAGRDAYALAAFDGADADFDAAMTEILTDGEVAGAVAADYDATNGTAPSTAEGTLTVDGYDFELTLVGSKVSAKQV